MRICSKDHWKICYDEYEEGGYAHDCPFCELLAEIKELKEKVEELQAEVDDGRRNWGGD